jgi:hypothetical protein
MRPAKLFTAHESLFSGIVGSLDVPTLTAIRNAVTAVIRG